jgi:[acyl-carrier-protein] S-malonyltransferase
MEFFMKNSAWLFPGQASQKVGMGLDLFESTEIGLKYFNQANEIMGYDIQDIIFNGPEETLRKTEYTQPAIYIVSVIIGQILLDKGFKPTVVAGHSLGEYSALTIAGSFDFGLGLNLVKIRSKSMAKAGASQNGSMAAIVGLDDKIVTEICNGYTDDGIVVAANFNSPGQIVISGNNNAVEWAMKKSKELGAKMCIKLNVSGAFHSPLMLAARKELNDILNTTQMQNANFPIYTNVQAKPVSNKKDIKNFLIQQLEKPVLWSKLITAIKSSGIQSFLEVGPGNVLKGLNKRIDRKLITYNFGTLKELEILNV